MSHFGTKQAKFRQCFREIAAKSTNMPRRPPLGNKCKHGPENTFQLSSPLGVLELVCCPKGIHKLHLLSVDCDANFKPVPDKQVGIERQLYEDNGYTYKSALLCVHWLQSYFHNLSDIKDIPMPPICPLPAVKSDGTKSLCKVSFMERVWHTLYHTVPCGGVVSYGELAIHSGSTVRASRAVGQAMRHNPVMILVPCHRVILSNGGTGNYSRGTKNTVKAWLLRHEGALD